VTDLHPLRMMIHVLSGGEADFDCEKGLDMLRQWRVLGNLERSDIKRVSASKLGNRSASIHPSLIPCQPCSCRDGQETAGEGGLRRTLRIAFLT
jgi:hypothetical protein